MIVTRYKLNPKHKKKTETDKVIQIKPLPAEKMEEGEDTEQYMLSLMKFWSPGAKRRSRRERER